MKSLIRNLFYQYFAIDSSSSPIAPPIQHHAARSLKILLLGTCQLELITKAGADSRHKIRHMLMGAHSSAPAPAAEDDDDVVVVSLPLRQVISEATGLSTPASDMVFARLRTPEEAQSLIEGARDALARNLQRVQKTHSERPVVFMSFFEPSYNYLGSLQDPYDPVSAIHIIRKLNEILSGLARDWPNFYFLDVNVLLNYVGREYLQDDIVLHATHGSFINVWDFKLDSGRLTAPQQLQSAAIYERTIRKFTYLFLNHLEEMVGVIEQNNPIKIIICDLDDTLWRGVAAESDDLSDEERIAGWPLGLIEALLFFKARGGILALCSKNEAGETAQRFERIFRGAITLDDFAAVRINWLPKSQNISDILAATNLLAKNALFIDDNMREVSEVSASHPEIRCLGADHYNWRRIVMHASETQAPFITDESLRRTALVRATAERRAVSAAPDSDEGRETWLRSLNLRQSFHMIQGESSRHYERAFELLNKTNQFNTTGRRWTKAEYKSFMAGGGLCFVSGLEDKHIDNGVIAVCMIEQNEIIQIVLSCRVFGLDAEVAVLSKAVDLILRKFDAAYGLIVDTGRNATCHAYFRSNGFRSVGQRFEITQPLTMPSHIEITAAASFDALAPGSARATRRRPLRNTA